MPINKSSGMITADEIRDEFGPSGTVSFDDYRVSETHGSLTNMPLDKLAGANQDKNIPSTGAIAFSDFYNSRLNIVVICKDGDDQASTVYDNNNSSRVKVVGGLTSRPSKSQTGGRRVYINVNEEIKSPGNHQGDRNKCALRTGEWVNGQFNNNVGTGTSVSVDIGGSGKIYGHGGKGGDGAGGGGNTGGGGQNGSSALGIEFGESNNKVFINNSGYLQAGYGGGGGGGSGLDDPNKEGVDYSNGGAGGGGGAGKPHGEGGSGGGAMYTGQAGAEGGTTAGGDGGGEGGYSGSAEKGEGNEGQGGSGGDGGGVGDNAGNGESSSGNGGPKGREGGGGDGGEAGWAILNENASNCITVTGSGTVADNRIQHNTNPTS